MLITDVESHINVTLIATLPYPRQTVQVRRLHRKREDTASLPRRTTQSKAL
jgi:hypothetical protein